MDGRARRSLIVEKYIYVITVLGSPTPPVMKAVTCPTPYFVFLAFLGIFSPFTTFILVKCAARMAKQVLVGGEFRDSIAYSTGLSCTFVT